MSRQPLSTTLPQELARTFIQEIQAELSTDSGVQLGFQLAEPELCSMSRQPLSITLPQELARTFIQEIQAVLDGDASYFHEELWADSACKLGLTCLDGVGGVL
jgi:hypothetical protein